MLYHLALFLKQYYSFFNIIHYTSFRAIAALLSSLFFSFFFGGWFIKKTTNVFKNSPREYTPESHKKKSNIPSMGGLFILANIIITILLWNNLSNIKIWIALFTIISFGIIGLIDDLRKINKKKGISASLKFFLQILTALIISCLCVSANQSTLLYFPFFKNFVLNLGIFYIFWSTFIIVGTSNAVNLTDGLDGLAIGSLITNFATFSIISFLAGNYKIASYLNIPFAGTAELAIFGAALVGASLGFLWYNTYPAQVIMGDIGSLSLGACLGLIGLMTKQELLLVLTGGLFVAETISVIVQVLSYKVLGRRLFKMAPMHHHFELIGWPESKITVRFGIISIILSLIALMTLKIR